MPAPTSAKLLNFRLRGGWYMFNFTAEGNDFAQALEAIKTVLREDRVWDPTTKTWALRKGPIIDELLAATFVNGRQCVETAAAQLRLF